MSMIFLAKGTCTLGMSKTDKDGNIVKSMPAQFTIDDAGGSVVVGVLDPETMKPVGPVDSVYGDWDAAGYLGKALELLSPGRKTNIPDLKSMAQNLLKVDRTDICEHCQDYPNCRDCIVQEWKDEIDNG